MPFPFQKMSGDPTTWGKATLDEQDRKLKEFKDICRPVVEYIQKKHTPHTRIIIDWSFATLVSEEMGVVYEVPD